VSQRPERRCHGRRRVGLGWPERILGIWLESGPCQEPRGEIQPATRNPRPTPRNSKP